MNVRSVARVVFAVSLSLWGIALVGLVALYLLGLVSGGLGGVEGFVASLGFTGFRLSILPFLLVFVVAGVLAAAVVGVLAGLVAHLYNAVGPLAGGIEVVTEERPTVRRTVPPPGVIRQPETFPEPPPPTPQAQWPATGGTLPPSP